MEKSTSSAASSTSASSWSSLSPPTSDKLFVSLSSIFFQLKPNLIKERCSNLTSYSEMRTVYYPASSLINIQLKIIKGPKSLDPYAGN